MGIRALLASLAVVAAAREPQGTDATMQTASKERFVIRGRRTSNRHELSEAEHCCERAERTAAHEHPQRYPCGQEPRADAQQHP